MYGGILTKGMRKAKHRFPLGGPHPVLLAVFLASGVLDHIAPRLSRSFAEFTFSSRRPKPTPGPSYIVSQMLSRKTAGYISFVALIHVASGEIGVYALVWAIVASSATVLLVALYFQSRIHDWRDKPAAAALGVRLIPTTVREGVLFF